MQKCKNCQAKKYTKAEFVKWRNVTNIKSVAASLYQQDRKEGVNKRS